MHGGGETETQMSYTLVVSSPQPARGGHSGGRDAPDLPAPRGLRGQDSSWFDHLEGSLAVPVCVKTEYLGISDHMELQVLLQLVLVVLVEQEILLFTGQGLELSHWARKV